MTKKRNAVLFFLTLFLASIVFSQEPEKKAPINFTIISIKASNSDKEKVTKKVDQDITNILKSLYKFNSYEEINRKNIRILEGEKGSASLPNSLSFEIEAKSEKNTINAKIIIKDKDNQELLNTNIEMQRGKKIILGGWSLNGDTMIVVIKAS
jgi:hypothetical protein